MTPNDPIDVEADYTDEELMDQDLGQDAGDVNYDDAEIYDENWDDAAEPVNAKPAKKKSKLFNVLLVGGAVVVGGFIIVSHFSPKKKDAGELGAPTTEIASSSSPVTNPGDPNSPPALNNELASLKNDVNEENTLPAANQPAMPVAPSQKGFMDNPTRLESDAAKANPSVPSLPDSPSMTGLDAPAAPATPAATVPATLPTSSDAQNLPTIDQIKKAAPATPATPVTSDSSKMAGLPVPSATSSQTASIKPATVQSVPVSPAPVKTSGPTTHEIELQSKLDDATSRIATLEKKIAEKPAPVSAPAGDSAQVAELKASVARLEDKIANMKQTAPAPSYSDTRDEMPVTNHIARKAPAPKKRKPAENNYAASSKWDLRGAHAGEAMLGKEGQAEFKTVHVGDTVAGLGQIQSISQIGGAWVVQGTGGKVSQ